MGRSGNSLLRLWSALCGALRAAAATRCARLSADVLPGSPLVSLVAVISHRVIMHGRSERKKSQDLQHSWSSPTPSQNTPPLFLRFSRSCLVLASSRRKRVFSCLYLAHPSLYRYRTTHRYLELARTAELDPIPQARLRNAQWFRGLVTSDGFTELDRLDLELRAVLPIRKRFLLAH